ncbi:MAG: aldose 1-epimerase family protein [Geodermatophilaceae bacterium]|nr:aldose 1-epimerase family protein [Geodermatophilaceae bacterium]
MSTAPSGEQFELVSGDQQATIVEVGGGVRAYTHAGRAVLQDYPLTAMCDGAHGAPLVPWPNRLGDGRYRFAGVDYRVALTEPEKSNAIHGFLRWSAWRPVRRAPDRIALAIRAHPRQGYPFTLDVEVEYGLDSNGLSVRTTATNVGDAPCPYGCGQHPYLSPGDALIDECLLEVAAGTRIRTDPDRQLPVGIDAVAGTEFDFRQPRRLGSLRIDDAFTDLDRDPQGRAWVRLHRPDTWTAELWVDRSYSLVELYTADTLTPARRRRGLGVEPMTCPPNAFQTGDRVRTLHPGEAAVAEWGVRIVPRNTCVNAHL